MDRLKGMRQRDWARVFGLGCVAVGIGLSVAGHAGAQWDAFILLLGAVMLLRAAVEEPAPSREAGLVRALRVILFMLAFGAVARAQSGGVTAAEALSGVLGNWLIWAVAGLLLALPLLRRGLAWKGGRAAGAEVLAMIAVAGGLWLLFSWIATEAAGLRTLVGVAVLANGVPILRAGQPWIAGVALAVIVTCLAVPPGALLWPVAATGMAAGAVLALLRGRAPAGGR